MRLLLLAAACLVLLVACTTTSAAPQLTHDVAGIAVDLSAEPSPDSSVRIVESIEQERYPVTGDSPASIRSALNRSGPYSTADGRIYDAITRWGMQWSFRYQSEPGSCRLAAATIDVLTVTVLPELSRESRLAGPARERWQAYIEALAGHEAGHVEGVQRGALALAAAMEAAPAMATCAEMGAHLSGLGDAYVQAMRAFDAAYDGETGHGKSQGAVFP